jgi:hypothetical protein
MRRTSRLSVAQSCESMPFSKLISAVRTAVDEDKSIDVLVFVVVARF